MNDHTHTSRINVAATSACLGSVACWTLGPIFIKYLTGYVDSWTQNLLRYSVACLFWLPFFLLAVKNQEFDKRIWRRAVRPALANVGMQSVWAAAFYYIGPAFMALLTQTAVIWIAGFSLVLFPDERALIKSRRFWLGLLLSVIGVTGVIYHQENFETSRIAIGIALAILSAFMWAVYTIAVRVAFKDVDSRQGFSVISIYTVGGLLVPALLFGDVGQCVEMGVRQWACVVISAVTAIALAHVLYYAAIKRIGATIPAIVILAQPFAVLAISHVVFNESLNAMQILHGVALLAGAGFAILAQQHLKT